MAKQDVLDAINATIIENGQKGITAQSLNNVLTMMVENAGEGGSGDGALRVIVPELMMLGPEFIHIGELSPTSWEEMKSNYEQSMGWDLSEYDAAVKTSFEHNANVVQQILEKGKARQGVSVVLDQTPYLPAAINLLFQVEPETAAACEDFAMCAVQPAGLFMQYIKPTPEGESMFGENVFSCALAPAGNMDFEGLTNYPSNMQIILGLDGSLTFTQIEEEQPSSGSGVVTFYMPSGETITDEEKAKNKAAYESWITNKPTPTQIANEDCTSYFNPMGVGADDSGISLHFAMSNGQGGFMSAIMYVSKDGSVTMQ